MIHNVIEEQQLDLFKDGEAYTLRTEMTATDTARNKCRIVKDHRTGEMIVRNPHFKQFYDKNLPLIRQMIKKSAVAAQIFFFFIEQMNDTNAIQVSQEALAEVCEKDKRTVARALKILTEMKLVQIVKSGNSNVYHINAEIVWQKARKDISHAKFRAIVYVSATEQVRHNNHKKVNDK